MNAYDAQYPHTSGVALRGVWIVHECTGSALNVRALTVHTPARISSCVPTKYVYVLVGVQAMYMYVRTYVRSSLSTKKYGSRIFVFQFLPSLLCDMTTLIGKKGILARHSIYFVRQSVQNIIIIIIIIACAQFASRILYVRTTSST